MFCDCPADAKEMVDLRGITYNIYQESAFEEFITSSDPYAIDKEFYDLSFEGAGFFVDYFNMAHTVELKYIE